MRCSLSALLGVFCLCFCLIGCKKSSTSGNNPEGNPTAESELNDIAELLKLAAHEGKSAPRNLQELSDISAAAPPGVTAVQEGRIVMNWGRRIDSTSKGVLAYEKDVASKGGKVLLQDGSVVSMSSAEFANAPPAR